MLVEVGLTAPRQAGRGYYDRFRDRVMFPIKDVRGQAIGFGGRIMPESPYAARAPKYYNSAETPLFSKSDVLYGLDMARHAGAAAGYLAVVEGYTDVMMAHQCGVPQVVATMGTALNAAARSRSCAGTCQEGGARLRCRRGRLSGVDRALEDLRLARTWNSPSPACRDGLDPCDLLDSARRASTTFKKVLAQAKDALDFRLTGCWIATHHPIVETTRRIVDDILGTLSIADQARSVQTQVKRELIVTRLSHRLGLRQETVWARLSELRPGTPFIETRGTNDPRSLAGPGVRGPDHPARRDTAKPRRNRPSSREGGTEPPPPSGIC